MRLVSEIRPDHTQRGLVQRGGDVGAMFGSWKMILTHPRCSDLENRPREQDTEVGLVEWSEAVPHRPHAPAPSRFTNQRFQHQSTATIPYYYYSS